MTACICGTRRPTPFVFGEPEKSCVIVSVPVRVGSNRMGLSVNLFSFNRGIGILINPLKADI